ncbi:GNAT family N-acetyltransferase [sulfur-oxidizing endosymbiont of Gigantopelta aegis]|uniref:GNAT family N-acetyltransferase n=1 Tax=sulfur-oxidizing endosymbiont of Gigantopelta aegis TaxID=2794934 RepID=UPI0018DEAF87|nr:GNAT family N-acetyltransferase [sulfur-oxidizing endosymbiont of Gigantopelta aegis]
MSDNTIIRKANESDLDEILALINSPKADNGTAMEHRDANTVYLSILDDSNYFQVVASTEEGIAGMISLVIIMQMTHEGSTTAFMTDLIIAENIENKNTLAQDLMQYCKDLAQEYGCYKLVCHSDYQTELLTSSCQAIGLEASSPAFVLAE